MNGIIRECGATDTKWFGIITGENGKEYHFEEPFYHLNDKDRAISKGQSVVFSVPPSFGPARHVANLAYDVYAI